MTATFAERLNRLFNAVYPPGRGPHTSAEVIAALKAEGITISAPYLSQLRSGNRTNPSSTTMTALANFFRVSPDFFTDDECYRRVDADLVWLLRARQEPIRQLVSLAGELSPSAQRELLAHAEQLRHRGSPGG